MKILILLSLIGLTSCAEKVRVIVHHETDYLELYKIRYELGTEYNKRIELNHSYYKLLLEKRCKK